MMWNPNFNNQYQTYPQLSQAMPTGLKGRIVDDISTVTPNETPMDGNISVFPTRNLDSVYLRQWQSDGKLITKRYVPDVEEISETEKSISLEDVMDRLDKIEKQIMVISKTETTTRSRTKKESEA